MSPEGPHDKSQLLLLLQVVDGVRLCGLKHTGLFPRKTLFAAVSEQQGASGRGGDTGLLEWGVGPPRYAIPPLCCVFKLHWVYIKLKAFQRAE